MTSNMSFKKILTALLLVFSFLLINSQISAQVKKIPNPIDKSEQNSLCSIGGFQFVCPDDYTKIEVIGKNTLLFKGNSSNLESYLFVSVPGNSVEENKVKKAIEKKFGSDNSKKFVWKQLKNPFLMTLDSKYAKTKSGSMGFDGSKLLNFISRQFLFKNKNISIGYVYDMQVVDAKSQFEKELGGDYAVGCNAIASLINSITKENKGRAQYCSLSVEIRKTQN